MENKKYLVTTRKLYEGVKIGDIEVVISRIKGGQIRLAVHAPDNKVERIVRKLSARPKETLANNKRTET